jgi:hypothetical protein
VGGEHKIFEQIIFYFILIKFMKTSFALSVLGREFPTNEIGPLFGQICHRKSWLIEVKRNTTNVSQILCK